MPIILMGLLLHVAMYVFKASNTFFLDRMISLKTKFGVSMSDKDVNISGLFDWKEV